MAALAESDVAPLRHARAWRLATDDQLARAAAAGSDAAYSAIFSRYHAALVRHCRAIVFDAHEAQDAAQDALAAALRALRGDGPQPLVLKPWLYRIAHNEALAVLRRRPAHATLDAEAHATAVAGPADDEVRERLRELVGDLHALPERQRGALLMRELSGLEYAEIATALGTTPQAARQIVFEARAALHAFGAGREAACDGVRRTLSDGDRRMLRGRRVRAHLRGCDACAAFARSIDARRRDLAILIPVGPALAMLAGAGASAGGGALVAGGGASAGGLALGSIGASVAAKCAAVCATAAIVGGSVAVIEDHAPPAHRDTAARVAPAPPAEHARATAEVGRRSSHVSHSSGPRRVRATPSHRGSGAAVRAQTVSIERTPRGTPRAIAHTPDRVRTGAQSGGHTPVAAPSEPAAPEAVSAPAATPATTTAQQTAVPAGTSARIQQAVAQAQASWQQAQALAEQIAADAATRLDAARRLISSALSGTGQ